MEAKNMEKVKNTDQIRLSPWDFSWMRTESLSPSIFFREIRTNRSLSNRWKQKWSATLNAATLSFVPMPVWEAKTIVSLTVLETVLTWSPIHWKRWKKKNVTLRWNRHSSAFRAPIKWSICEHWMKPMRLYSIRYIIKRFPLLREIWTRRSLSPILRNTKNISRKYAAARLNVRKKCFKIQAVYGAEKHRTTLPVLFIKNPLPATEK